MMTCGHEPMVSALRRAIKCAMPTFFFSAIFTGSFFNSLAVSCEQKPSANLIQSLNG